MKFSKILDSHDNCNGQELIGDIDVPDNDAEVVRAVLNLFYRLEEAVCDDDSITITGWFDANADIEPRKAQAIIEQTSVGLNYVIRFT